MKLNSFQLKCIAMITMLIDHIGAVLFPGQYLLRIVGRISFPIFCFLLVEGFFYTKNVKKYMIRLAGFAIVSEIPYDLVFRNVILEFEHQNVMFTLLLGVILMNALQKTKQRPVLTGIYTMLAFWAANTFGLSYDCRGILLILVFYFFRENKTAKLMLEVLWNFLFSWIQFFGGLAAIPIMMYNGEKGKSMKYLFYVFYPIHLLILYFVSVILS